MNWDNIFESIIVLILIPFVAGTLVPLGGKALRDYFSKNAKVLKVVKAAVNFAEESGLGLVADEKLSLAINFATQALADKGYEKVDINLLIQAIEGEVATSLNLDKAVA